MRQIVVLLAFLCSLSPASAQVGPDVTLTCRVRFDSIKQVGDKMVDVDTKASKINGYAATISDGQLRWTEVYANGDATEFSVNRYTGSIMVVAKDKYGEGVYTGECALATQKKF
jgi:hypothetical protein